MLYYTRYFGIVEGVHRLSVTAFGDATSPRGGDRGVGEHLQAAEGS